MVFQQSPFAVPVGSFQAPVPIPTSDPSTGPFVYLPVNCEWLPYIAGALSQLQLQTTWRTDDPTELQNVQDRVANFIAQMSCFTLPTLQQLTAQHGSEIEDFMPLRVDCDCNVWITCCDGTEKQILTSDQVKKLVSSQPGDGTPQPEAGGCKTYGFEILAGNSYLVPTIVSTGDVLTLENLDGASTDVAPIGRWNCPTGDLFFAGKCNPEPFIDGSAPEPTLPIGIPLYVIGTNYYDGRVPFTVPGSLSNVVVGIILNYPSGGNYGGTITGSLEVCNNQSPAWSHTWDFTTAQGPWVPESDATNTNAAVWSPGIGWVQTDQHISGSSYQRIVGIQLDPIAFSLDSLSFTFTRVMGHLDATATSGQNLVYDTSVVDTQTWGSLVNGTAQNYNGPQPATITSRIAVLIGCANSNSGPNTDGSCIITKATVTGHGTDPFV